MLTGSSTITSGMILPVLLGIVFAGVSGYAVMRFMIKKLSIKGIAICGVYVVVLGALILVDQNFTHILM
jgi:undecaprenyl-diphosphatase